MAIETNGTVALLQATVNRLKSVMPDFAVEFFPDKPDEYRLNHPKGALLVQYLRSAYGNQADLDMVVQVREVSIAISVVQRQLNGRDGAVNTVDAVRSALQGFAPVPWRRFRMVEDRFVSENQSIWTYLIVVSTDCMTLESRDEETGPLATQIDFDDNYGGAHVPRIMP